MTPISTEDLVARYLSARPKVQLTRLTGDQATFRCQDHGTYQVQIPPAGSANRYIPRCNACGNETRAASSTKWTTPRIRKLIQEQYGSRFSTSKVQYVNYHTPIVLGCKEHGEFSVTINALTSDQRKYLCAECWNSERAKKVTEAALVESLEQQGGGVTLVSCPTPLKWDSRVTLSCPAHGTYSCRRGKEMRCPCCVRDYKCVIAGREFLVQGYERFVIPDLLRWMRKHDLTMRHLFEAKHPKQEKRPPRFDYLDDEGEWHSYYPDFWIPTLNTIVEVKSDYTAGIGRYSKINKVGNRTLRLKKKAVEDEGFRCLILIHERSPSPRTYQLRL